jgi:hypothetical protein
LKFVISSCGVELAILDMLVGSMFWNMEQFVQGIFEEKYDYRNGLLPDRS